MHPRLGINQAFDAPPIYQDISVLENENSTEFMTQVRGKMLTRESGSYEMLITRLLPRGDSTYEGEYKFLLGF